MGLNFQVHTLEYLLPYEKVCTKKGHHLTSSGVIGKENILYFKLPFIRKFSKFTENK